MEFFTALKILLVSVRLSHCASCLASSATIHYVHSCPTSKEAWDAAAQRKNCSAAEHNCTTTNSFVYHCLPNSAQDKLLEVCSSPEVIAFPVCAEFNERKNRILENHLTDCSVYTIPCPTRYISTDAYKYPECFNVTQQTTISAKTLSNERTTYKQLPTDETSRSTIGNGTNTNEFALTFNLFTLKHPQLLLSFIVALGIVLPVISFILIARAISTKKSNNSTNQCDDQLNNQPGPSKTALLRKQSRDSEDRCSS